MAQHQIFTVEIDGKQYDLEGDHAPSEAEARAAIKSQPEEPFKGGWPTGTNTAQDNPQSVAELEAAKNPSLLTRTNQALAPLAHPKTAADFAMLAIPSGIPNLRIVENATRIGRAVKDTAIEANSVGSVLRAPGRIIGKVAESYKRPWNTINDLPLAQQMEHLPTTGPGPMPRPVGSPPASTAAPFHERPLAEQVAHLPTTGNLPLPRAANPPTVAGVPFHTQPLATQMDRLPTNGPTPLPRPAGPPPRVSATPFHELPLHQQMDHLPTGGTTPLPRPVSLPAGTAQAERAEMAVSHTPVPAPVTEVVPVAANAASPVLPESWKPFASHEPVAPAAPAGNLDPASLPSWSDQTRSLSNEWHSGATEAGEKARVSALHRNDALLGKRFRFLLDNPTASVALAAGGGTAGLLAALERELLARKHH